MLLFVCICVATLPTLHELLLLIVKVVPEDVPVVVQDVFVVRVVFQLLHDVKEHNVLIIESLVKDFKGFVPGIGVSNRVGHLVLISEIGVGDMLSEPVLGKVNPLLGMGVVSPPMEWSSMLWLLMCWCSSFLG